MAKYAAEGARVCLVTCTGGEEGEIHFETEGPDPDQIRPQLRQVREDELREAVEHLGVTDLRLLGYRDSGMDGTESTQLPDAFTNVRVEEVVARLVEIIRDVKPQVIVTYNAFGFYGHPDHIVAHRATVAAFDAAAHPKYRPDLGPAHSPSKLYYTAVPRSHMRAIVENRDEVGLSREEEQEFIELAAPDEVITARIDAPEYAPQVEAAIRAHRTQYGTTRRFLELEPQVQQVLFGHNSYERVRSSVPVTGVESDLFEGL